ncbi:extracellular solute-binding protein [Pseudonocardia sichuanensis]
MKRRRPVVTGVVAGVAAAALSGCAGNAAGADPQALDLWLPPQADITDASDWDPILAGFEQQHGVDVNVRIIPWDSYEAAFLTGVSGGEGPDVGLMYTDMMGDYLVHGAIVPFGGHLDAAGPPDYLYLERGVVDGEQVAIPFVVGGVRVLYYNADLLAAAGVDEPPATWDEFLAACERLRAAGTTPLVQPWGHHRGMLNENFFPFLWQAGGTLFTEDGSATAFHSPEGVAAATYLLRLQETGAMPDSVTSLIADDAESAFLRGESAFLFSSDAKYATFDREDFDLGFVASLEGERRGTFVATDSLVVLDECADEQLCTDLAVYITSPPQMEQFHELAQYPPLSTGEEYVAPPEFRSVYAQDDLMHNLPIVAGSPAVYNSLLTNLQQMLLGQKTPEQALADAAADGDRALRLAQR